MMIIILAVLIVITVSTLTTGTCILSYYEYDYDVSEPVVLFILLIADTAINAILVVLAFV